MPHIADFSQRDLLRIDAVGRLAGLFAPGDGRDAMVVGSVALAAHLSPSRYRVPNDLDIVVRGGEARIDGIIGASPEIGTSSPMTTVPMFSSGGPVREVVLSVGPPDGRAVDRIPCQFIERWPQESHGVPVVYGGGAIRAESLEWLVAHKIHALLKARKSSRVSSRVRDLFDLALLDALDRMPPQDTIGNIVTLFPEPMSQEMRALPEEWRVQWRSMQREVGGEISLDAAWSWVWDYWNGSAPRA